MARRTWCGDTGAFTSPQLHPDLPDIVPETERELIPQSAGMGEGLHLYKIRGKDFLTSAWYLDEMRMPVARADRLEGPWEVNQNVSRGEDFGLGVGYRVADARSTRSKSVRRTPPSPVVAPSTKADSSTPPQASGGASR